MAGQFPPPSRGFFGVSYAVKPHDIRDNHSIKASFHIFRVFFKKLD